MKFLHQFLLSSCMMVHGMSLQASLEEGKLNSLNSTENSEESIKLNASDLICHNQNYGLELYLKDSGLYSDKLQAVSNEENVQTILAKAPYLTARELFIKFALEAEPHDMVLNNRDLNVAVFRRLEEEKSLEIDDKRSIVDRMIAHENLNEEQFAIIENWKKLSLPQIEAELADKVYDDVCMNIGKEICKSKIRDQATEMYKNYTAQQVCDEVNKADKPSQLVVGVYRGVTFNKMITEIAQYAAQHKDTFDMNVFIESKRSEADSNRITSESSQK